MDAFDEAVWSRHPDAGVKLARATVTTEPGTPRRARNKSSNIARGMPDVFGCTCDYSCAFSLSFPAHESPGATASGIPCALSLSRADVLAKPGQIMPRECALTPPPLSSPAKAGDPVFQSVPVHHQLSGILDRPVEPGDDGRVWGVSSSHSSP